MMVKRMSYQVSVEFSQLYPRMRLCPFSQTPPLYAHPEVSVSLFAIESSFAIKLGYLQCRCLPLRHMHPRLRLDEHHDPLMHLMQRYTSVYLGS